MQVVFKTEYRDDSGRSWRPGQLANVPDHVGAKLVEDGVARPYVALRAPTENKDVDNDDGPLLREVEPESDDEPKGNEEET